ncbi:uncharacterized protein CLUP02_14174 [Colletotrichum lupini]|uniref:Uncharacterized protein n=1 Tax=Colletotrichum lupini TaxID=145971 RepID=A0A9Q8T3J8_9PEZI|nr:uncharacterized protein CLUP02_14174 [Colletotrichum lupini]KAK1705849.1 hypothetical protein BDP67DRAFT_622977 [Colletotrichum lupini]UQC88649.1 hypothetical protein CLUP02_14174 [Colletotrichum lupini]
MKSQLLLPAALLTLTHAATIPESAKPIIVPDSTLDAAIREPLKNFITGPVHGIDPSAFFPATALSENDEYKLAAAGEVAWAAIELEASAALAGSVSASHEGESLRDAATVAVNSIARSGVAPPPPPPHPPHSDPPHREPHGHHEGISREQLCEYYKGIAWKTGDLQTAVYQWQYEYVPWLVHNKGPYIVVLDGLRHIEWVLWKIEQALVNAHFYYEDEFDILKCYQDFSGRELQITHVPTTAPALPTQTTANMTIGLPTNTMAHRPRAIDEQLVTTTVTIQPARPTTPPPPPGHPENNNDRPEEAGNSWPHLPWRRDHPSMKKLLRLITAKAPVSKYQSYANHRIYNVLKQLEYTALASASALRSKLRDPHHQSLLDYDIWKGQGINHAFEVAIAAYEVK